MTEQILAVQRMQEYIESHLSDNITINDLSNVSYFSPWHSYRLFCEHLGQSPAKYIRRLRLSKSALLLKNKKAGIMKTAFEMGFGSVDGYTRAFNKEFGCNPSEYAKNPVPITLFRPYGVKFKELRKEKINMENLKSIFVQVVSRPERKAIIKRGVNAKGYFDYCEEVGCDVWGMLMSMDSLDGEPVSMMLSEEYRESGTSVYVQGVEVSADYNGIVPDGFDVIELPQSEYLYFRGEPFKEEDFSEAVQAVGKAVKKYDPSVIGFEWDKSLPSIQFEPKGERGHIELYPVKRLS